MFYILPEVNSENIHLNVPPRRMVKLLLVHFKALHFGYIIIMLVYKKSCHLANHAIATIATGL